jgi:hypothetical protein
MEVVHVVCGGREQRNCVDVLTVSRQHLDGAQPDGSSDRCLRRAFEPVFLQRAVSYRYGLSGYG